MDKPTFKKGDVVSFETIGKERKVGTYSHRLSLDTHYVKCGSMGYIASNLIHVPEDMLKHTNGVLFGDADKLDKITIDSRKKRFLVRRLEQLMSLELNETNAYKLNFVITQLAKIGELD